MNPNLMLSRLVRFRLRTLMGLVALLALIFCFWELLFDPARRWARTIRDDDAGISRWEAVARALKGSVPGIDDATAIATLTEALGDPSWRVRENAAAALGAFGLRAESAIPALSKLLRDEPDRIVRMRVSSALLSILVKSRRADKKTVDSLVAALRDSDRHVRVQAASALVEIGQAEAAISTLIESLRSQDHWSRGDAIWALEEAGPSARTALPALIAMVNEPEEQGGQLMKFQRVQAAKLLHQLGKTDLALRILRRSAQDGDLTTSQEARKALMVVNPNETLNDEHKKSR